MTSSSAVATRGTKPPATDGPFVVEFIEAVCRRTEGRGAGQPLRLAPWQRDLLGELFELRPDGRRRYRQALIGMPRKQGKSTMGAGMALFFLLADGEQGAQVYSCAGDRDQARIVFGTAKKMVEMEPELSGRLKVYRDAIEHPASGSVYRVLSAEAYTKEGLNPSAVIFDELHVQPSRELWDVMTMGSGTRSQPIVIAITTAGYDLEGTICGEKYQYGKRVRSGEIVDPTFYFKWWEPSRSDCDYRDPAVWTECNPALGDFLHLEDLEQAAQQTAEHVFRRYRLNQWTATAEAWLPFGAWQACCDPSLELDPALPLRVGIDIGRFHDATAVVCAQKQGERIVLRSRTWSNPYPEGHTLHDSWSMNIFEVEEHLKALYAAFPVPATEIDGRVVPGPEFAHDPALFQRSPEVLEGFGLAMVKYPQHSSYMVPACQGFYQLVMERKIAHDGDPILAQHIANATVDQTDRGWRLTKPKGSRRLIDAAIAAAIASHRAQEPSPQPRRSVYEDHGLLVTG